MMMLLHQTPQVVLFQMTSYSRGVVVVMVSSCPMAEWNGAGEVMAVRRTSGTQLYTFFVIQACQMVAIDPGVEAVRLAVVLVPSESVAFLGFVSLRRNCFSQSAKQQHCRLSASSLHEAVGVVCPSGLDAVDQKRQKKPCFAAYCVTSRPA
jgi:hypothetical protein